MFRNGHEMSDGEISDDEPLLKNARNDVADHIEQKKGNSVKNPWGDLIVERELDRVGAVRMEDKVVERGVESFAMPATAKSTTQISEAGKKTRMPPPMIAVSPADEDDPFAGTPAQLANVEKFGFDSQAGTSAPPSYCDYPKKRGAKRGNYAGAKRLSGRIEFPSNSQSIEQNGGTSGIHRGQSTFGRGMGPRGMTVRGRGGPPGMSRGAINRVKEEGWVRGKRTHDQMQDLRGIMTRGYSVENLMAASFEDDLSLDELGNAMAEALGERDPTLIRKMVNSLGKDLAYRIFEKTREVETSGGMMVQDGSRRRTPGGVFMIAYRDDTTVPKSVKDEIAAMNVQRTIKKAKRRNKKPV